jgi:undecaprenyl-diphosphatase
MASLDEAAFHWLNGVAVHPWLDVLMRVVTNGRFWAPVLVIVLFDLLTRRGRRGRVAALAAVAALALADLLAAQVLKPWVGRLRPCQTTEAVRLLVSCGGRYGFPSNHAANGAALATALGFFYPASLRYTVAAVLVVAWSRVYVGVHYPGDVLAGLALGALLGGTCGWAARTVLRRAGSPDVPPPDAGGTAAGAEPEGAGDGVRGPGGTGS